MSYCAEKIDCRNLVLLISNFPAVIETDWSKGTYTAIEGVDSMIYICAEILSGSLETTVVVPFMEIEGTGMYYKYVYFHKMCISGIPMMPDSMCNADFNHTT